ncbi:MAG: RDD family protein [Candidatus Binatia bacterium]
MNCQNCEALVPPDAEHCEKCGAKLLSRKVVFGAPRREEFTLTAEEEPVDLDQPVDEETWRFPAPSEKAPSSLQPEREAAVEVTYGGFLRRLGAFGVDLTTIVLLCALMGVMAYAGYKVGLTAHGRSVSLENAMPLVVLLTFSWFLLATAYFVVFHGMEGKTIGKWLFGLRVVGEARQPISYRRALLRWIAWLGFGCSSMGLSFLWILWSREKRAWHDFLARTWVVRE